MVNPKREDLLMQLFGDMRESPEDLERRALVAAENMALRNAMRMLAESDDGRRLLLYLMDESGILKAAWNENPNYAAFLEGKRLMGMVLLRLAQEAGVVEKLMAVKNA